MIASDLLEGDSRLQLREHHRVPRGLPGVRKQTWEFREAKMGEVDKAEYKRGASCTERKPRDLKRVPLET